MPALHSQGPEQVCKARCKLPKWCLLYTVRADTCLHLQDTSRHSWQKPVNSSLEEALLLLHMCVHAVSGRTCMWRDSLKRHASGTAHLLRVILTGLKLTNQAWLEGQQVLGTTCLYLPATGITTECCHASIVHRGSGDWTRVLVFVCQPSNHPSLKETSL